MYDLVGEKIQRSSMPRRRIRLYDLDAGTVDYPYFDEGGVRIAPLHSTNLGLTRPLTEDDDRAARAVLVSGLDANWAAQRHALCGRVGGPTQSAVFVPMIVGDQVIGRISLQNMTARTRSATATSGC